MITLKIDVSKITKSRLFTGKKGVYLDAKLIPTPESEYGDFMIVESTSKEEYESGVKGVILGNGKEFKPQDQSNSAPAASNNSIDDLPF